VAGPVSRVLSSSQLATLAEVGEERTAEAGETLYEIGDETHPFIAIIEGEAAVLDSAGREIVRHGASGFLGEMNLLSGQTVFLTAVATEPMRYIAVDREVLRRLLFEDGSLSDLLLQRFHPAARAAAAATGGRGRDPRLARFGRNSAAARVRQADATPPFLGRPGG
jgi:thioredoxin reductase (NADPH)